MRRTHAWLALGLAGALSPALAQQQGGQGQQGTPQPGQQPNTNQPTPGQQDPQADQQQPPNTNQPTPGQGAQGQGTPRTPAQESENPFTESTLDGRPTGRRLNFQPTPREWERQRIEQPAGHRIDRDEWVITKPAGMRREPPVTGDPPVTAPPPDTGARPFRPEGPRVSVSPLDRRYRGFDAFRRGLLTDWRNAQGDPLTDLDQNVIVRREGDTEIRLIEQSGSFQPRTGRGLERGKLVTGWVRNGEDAWEVRLLGEPEQVDAQREAFVRWLDSVNASEVDTTPPEPRGDLPSPPGPP